MGPRPRTPATIAILWASNHKEDEKGIILRIYKNVIEEFSSERKKGRDLVAGIMSSSMKNSSLEKSDTVAKNEEIEYKGVRALPYIIGSKLMPWHKFLRAVRINAFS